MTMNDSTKKTVWITGVSRGLGREMAIKFVEAGWRVAGCARTEVDALEGLVFCRADLASDEDAARFVQAAYDQTGAPHLLLNNAAVINPNAVLWEMDAPTFDRVIDVNIKGVASVIRHAVPLMIGRGTGVIVNFSSGWGRSTSPEVAPYCATKWAIEGLTAAMAQELPHGVAAASLNPGIIDTEMLQSCFGSGASSYPSAAEWAETAVPFLMGLDSNCNGRQLTAP